MRAATFERFNNRVFCTKVQWGSIAPFERPPALTVRPHGAMRNARGFLYRSGVCFL